MKHMLKLAALIDNPGEPPIDSRYQAPEQLKALGYTGRVIYGTTALSGVESAEVISDAEMRRWVQNAMDEVTRTIDSSRRAGLDVYLFYDCLVLATDVVERNTNALTCRGRRDVLCPASEQAVELSVRAMETLLRRWPEVSGIVLRFGDCDAGRLPHIMGNDIYFPHCPRCSQLGRADRIAGIIDRFYQRVVMHHDKQLIVRGWNVRPGGLHDTADLARRVVERLPGEPEDSRLILSFKFTQTDFWRYQRWNPSSLVCGKRPVIYEFQCQREFEGKGGLPNWQAPLWRDGYPELQEADSPSGLAKVVDTVNLAGVWAWVRGGGWGGPFVNNETWIDANVYALAKLGADPKMNVKELSRQWVDERLDIPDPAIADCLMTILDHSPQIILQAFYIHAIAAKKNKPWHPNADWIQDDLLDVQAAWRMIQRLPEHQLDEVLHEKQSASEQITADLGSLQHLLSAENQHVIEPLVNSLQYAESFIHTLRDLLTGLVAYRRFLKSRQPASAQIARQKLFDAQAHWNHHTQRHGSLPGAATAFREVHFWELTQKILDELNEAG